METESPLVSIIVRTKDRPHLLKRVLKSISEQSYRPLEAVIVNDGGCELHTDELRGILGDVSLNYIRLETNRGRAFAGNTGIKNSSGGYLCFLDDDDEYYPEHISTLVPAALQDGYKIVYADAVKIRREFDELTGNIKDDDIGVFSSYDFSYIDLVTENYIPLTTILFHKDIFSEFGYLDEEFELYEDWDFLLRIAKKYPPFHIPKPTVKYILWNKASQISLDEAQRDKYYRKIFDKYRDKFTAEVVLNIKEKRNLVEEEYRKSLDNYRDLENDYRKLEVYNSELEDDFKGLKNNFKGLEKEYKDYIALSQERIRNLKEEMHDMRSKLDYQKSVNETLEKKVELLEREIHLMMNTIGWKVLTKMRRVRDKIIPQGTFRRKLYEKLISPLKYKGLSSYLKKTDNEYSNFVKENEPGPEDLKTQLSESLHLPYRPKISIIVPVYNTNKDMLLSMLNSVLSQTYDNWELCVADGNSSAPYIKDVLKEYAGKDDRIKVEYLDKNYNIAGNSKRALQMTTGDFIALLDHDDELAPHALYEVVRVMNDSPSTDIIYSDEDKINLSGERREPFFKPDWSPDLLMSVNYICHLMVIRKKLVDKVGGFREGYDGAQDYDLVLRCVSETPQIVHIPKILYHWKMHAESSAQDIFTKDYAHKAGKNALGEYLRKRGIDADIFDGTGITNYRIRYRLNHMPKVSIIIPFKDRHTLLKRCLESIVQESSYKNYELVLVSNNSTEKKLFDYLETLKTLPFVKILDYNYPFNYSAINNYAVRHSDGEVLLFLNNDTEVISEDWIESMLEHAMRKEIGAVGCKLLFPDNTVQHAGVVIGLTGFAGHVFSKLRNNAYTYFGSVDFVRNYLAVTGACMMIRREVFEEIGGFDERFILCGSDVDICLRLVASGHRIIYTPFATLYHHEAVTRGRDIPAEDFRLSYDVYNKYLNNYDPYYNPNLTRLKTDCSLRINGEETILEGIRAHALGKD